MQDYATMIAIYLFIIMICGIILIGIITLIYDKINDRINKRKLLSDNSEDIYNNGNNNSSNNIMGTDNPKINNRQNMESYKCYEDGKITNICAIIVLKTILKEFKHNLSNMEKDAINKGIDSIISMEKLNNYINDEKNIDIEEYI